MHILLEAGGSAATEALKSGLTTVGSDMTNIVTTVLPIALGIVGMVMVITFGIKFFQKVTGNRGK